VLVFTRTKHGANKLAKQLLSDGVSATAIHGNKSQAARTSALADFKKGAVRTLVATDIAARGLDIDSLPYVVNYDLPHVPEDYVHRIGRTGRAGANGMALSLVCAEEHRQLADIQRLLQRKIQMKEVAGFNYEHVPAAPSQDFLYEGRQSRPHNKNANGYRGQHPRPRSVAAKRRP
jgi:ATP-dependent RNA helicase RhlE